MIAVPELAVSPAECRVNASELAIGLIGCGGITQSHFAGVSKRRDYRVAALASAFARAGGGAEGGVLSRRRRYHTDWLDLLERDDVSRGGHRNASPEVRAYIIEAALRAGKHVLSQKPFVLDR